MTINLLASKMHVTPSTASKALLSLENNFEYPLIIHTKRGIFLTQEAQTIADATLEYLKIINRFKKTTLYSLQGKLSLAAPLHTKRLFGNNSISRFIRENPNVDFIIFTSTPGSIEKYLDDNSAEIVIAHMVSVNGNFYPDKYTFSSAPAYGKYMFTPCTSYKLCVECHKDLAYKKSNFALSDLVNKKLFTCAQADSFEESPLNIGVKRLEPSLKCLAQPDIDLYYKLLSNKVGYGLSFYNTQNSAWPDNIVQIPIIDDITIYFGYLEKDTTHSEAALAFIDILKESC